MNTVDYTPVPSLESLQKRVTALEAREVDLVERLRVAENLLETAAPIIGAITELERQGPPTGRAHRWLWSYRWLWASQRTKESGHG
jgi:hypothetical protein